MRGAPGRASSVSDTSRALATIMRSTSAGSMSAYAPSPSRDGAPSSFDPVLPDFRARGAAGASASDISASSSSL